jgi:coenzyme PQQ precursor peptide PqqA
LTEKREVNEERFVHRSIFDPLPPEKIPLANFSFRTTLSGGRSSSGFTLRRAKMAWKAPKIVEVPVGMEINMYACAARK